MSELHRHLSELHEALAQAPSLSQEDRRMLETVLLDIQTVLERDGDPAAPGDHGDALEGAAVRLEVSHPSLAAAVRGVLDALAKAGI
jgi:hypothetical protein